MSSSLTMLAFCKLTAFVFVCKLHCSRNCAQRQYSCAEKC